MSNPNRIIIGSHARWFALTADLSRMEPPTGTARVIVRCARNLGIARRAASARIECAAHAVRPAMLRECRSRTVGVCNRCGDETHQQHDRPSDERCQEHGHIEANCFKPRSKACGRSDQVPNRALGALHALSTSTRNKRRDESKRAQ
jgi:hypothetical protein